MDNKKLGIILLSIGIIILVLTTGLKLRQDSLISEIVRSQGSCFLEDGTCLHEEKGIMPYVLFWIISAFLISLGTYLLFFEKSQKAIVSTLERQKQETDSEERFKLICKALDDDEKKVLKAIKEQEGITQQTLRFRTGLHKSKLSIILKMLEKKELVARKKKGKTMQVFLKMKL